MFVWRGIKKKNKEEEEEEEEHQETRLPSTACLRPGFLLSLSCDSVKIEGSGQTLESHGVGWGGAPVLPALTCS